jgi:hypothetical protein
MKRSELSALSAKSAVQFRSARSQSFLTADGADDTDTKSERLIILGFGFIQIESVKSVVKNQGLGFVCRSAASGHP